jgi:hypothetical protein
MFQHIQPVQARQGQVEDCHVILELRNHELRFIPILRNIHGVLFGFQALLDKIGDWFVVFCYEHSHLFTFSAAECCPA